MRSTGSGAYAGSRGRFTFVIEERPASGKSAYRETALKFTGTVSQDVPDIIRKMIRLYEYGDGSLLHKARNFYRQGKFMEHYEDDAPWNGFFSRYFTTYHDLSVRQLRGYFTWRTHVRKGEYGPVSTSLAYMYIYELLCGIGTDSPEDSIQKMEEFRTGYLDSGIGDPGMKRNLNRWMKEFSIIYGLPQETVLRYTDPSELERDRAAAVLRRPAEHTDEEIYLALCALYGSRLSRSPVICKDEKNGKRLFASVWRYTYDHYGSGGMKLFTACFGKQRTYRWHPLSNAVFRKTGPDTDRDYVLNECRSYHCRSGIWTERRYEKRYFDKGRFCGLIREADRLFRRMLTTGHYLSEKPEDAWAAPFVQAVIESERQAESEAERRRIHIDYSGLNRIRSDALITRDSLLTEDEKYEAEEEKTPAVLPASEPVSSSYFGLDDTQLSVLYALLKGESADGIIRDKHLMPSLVMDTVNEALFDEIGDNVVEQDGDRLMIIEDYREDVIQLLGGQFI